MENAKLKLYQKKFKLFLKKYKALYPQNAMEFIEKEFHRGINDPCTVDILMQVYQEIGVDFGMPSFYEAHLKKIMENFDIGCNVVEVASGMYPAFGNLIAQEQLKIQKGTITLYDRALIAMKPKYPNMTIIRERFELDTDVSDKSLIVGTLPCGATETIIENACRNRKNFYIAMCGCTHFNSFYPVEGTPEKYQKQVINLAEICLDQFDNGKLVVDYLDDNYTLNYPILYNIK